MDAEGERQDQVPMHVVIELSSSSHVHVEGDSSADSMSKSQVSPARFDLRGNPILRSRTATAVKQERTFDREESVENGTASVSKQRGFPPNELTCATCSKTFQSKGRLKFHLNEETCLGRRQQAFSPHIAGATSASRPRCSEDSSVQIPTEIHLLPREYQWMKDGASLFYEDAKNFPCEANVQGEPFMQDNKWMVVVNWVRRGDSGAVECKKCTSMENLGKRRRKAPLRYGEDGKDEKTDAQLKKSKRRQEGAERRTNAATATLSTRSPPKVTASTRRPSTEMETDSWAPEDSEEELFAKKGEEISAAAYSKSYMNSSLSKTSSDSSVSSLDESRKDVAKPKSVSTAKTPTLGDSYTVYRFPLPGSSSDNDGESIPGEQEGESIAQRLTPRQSEDQKSHLENGELLTSFEYVKDDRQSDKNGIGMIAKETISKGKTFVDFTAAYVHGNPPAELYSPHGKYVKSKDGYFKIYNSLSMWINEPRNGKVANIKFRCDYRRFGRSRCDDRVEIPVLTWAVIKKIHVGDEVLVDYGGNF